MAQATIPLLFIFATISLVLSAMQVVLSVPVDGLWFQHPRASGVQHMNRAFWVFSIAILLLSGIVWVLLFGIPLIALTWQLSWGFQQRRREAQARKSSKV